MDFLEIINTFFGIITIAVIFVAMAKLFPATKYAACMNTLLLTFGLLSIALGLYLIATAK